MKITKATILITDGADEIVLHTDLPSTMPGVTSQSAAVSMKAQKDTGKAYVERHFPGVQIEIISYGASPYRFSK